MPLSMHVRTCMRVQNVLLLTCLLLMEYECLSTCMCVHVRACMYMHVHVSMGRMPCMDVTLAVSMYMCIETTE